MDCSRKLRLATHTQCFWYAYRQRKINKIDFITGLKRVFFYLFRLCPVFMFAFSFHPNFYSLFYPHFFHCKFSAEILHWKRRGRWEQWTRKHIKRMLYMLNLHNVEYKPHWVHLLLGQFRLIYLVIIDFDGSVCSHANRNTVVVFFSAWTWICSSCYKNKGSFTAHWHCPSLTNYSITRWKLIHVVCLCTFNEISIENAAATLHLCVCVWINLKLIFF